jgi:hypothetical protein
MRKVLPILAIVAAVAAPAMAADRLSDRDLKALVARIEDGRHKFEDALDGKLKNNTLRGSTGEVKVSNFLNDFQENIDKLDDRLNSDYAASAEAATVLRQATAIDQFFRTQPAGTKGDSEWNRLAVDLKALAVAYGTDFPTPEGAAVRRLGDKEVAKIVDNIAEAGDRLENSLDNELKKDATIDLPTRTSIVNVADEFANDARKLRDKVKDGDPSSSEAQHLLERAMAIQSILRARQVPTSSGIWNGVPPLLQQMAGAYGLTWSAR